MRKINIHMTVDAKTYQYCRDVNTGVRGITNSVINFDSTSPMIPHITLVMGNLDEQAYSLESVIYFLQECAKDLQSIEFNVSSPYLENAVNKYVFADVDGGEGFLKLRAELKAQFGSKYLQDVDGSYGEQPPHLTLAHVEEKQEEVRKYLETINAGFVCKSRSIEISDVGPKGTCINSLYKLELPQGTSLFKRIMKLFVLTKRA